MIESSTHSFCFRQKEEKKSLDYTLAQILSYSPLGKNGLINKLKFLVGKFDGWNYKIA